MTLYLLSHFGFKHNLDQLGNPAESRSASTSCGASPGLVELGFRFKFGEVQTAPDTCCTVYVITVRERGSQEMEDDVHKICRVANGWP
jgi:hypothetical protein